MDWRPIISGLVGARVVYLLFRLARPVATLVTLFFVLASAYLLCEVFLVKLGYDQRCDRLTTWRPGPMAEFVEYVEHRSEMA